MIDLPELDRLLGEATPERWTVAREIDAGRGRSVGCGEMRHIRVSTPVQYSASGTRTITPAERDADAALIAALRNAAPELIAAARERDAYRSRYENAIDASKDGSWMARTHDAERERDAARAEVARVTADALAVCEWADENAEHFRLPDEPVLHAARAFLARCGR